MRHLLTRTATIIRPTTDEDVYGDITETDTETTEVACWLNVTSSDEESGSANAEHAEAMLMLPLDTDITSGDRVDVDGEWHVIGAPVVRYRPTGPSHLEVELRRRQ